MASDNGASEAGTALPLVLDLDVEGTKAGVVVVEPTLDEALAQKASDYASSIVALDPDDEASVSTALEAVEGMGRALQRRAASRSRMLQAPLRDLSREGEEGGPVAKSLAELRIQVQKLDPTALRLEAGLLNRLLAALPGVGTPLQRYFMQFESSQGVIDAIIRSLENGRDQLKRDNLTLGEDLKNMRELTLTLSEQVAMAQALDAAIRERLEEEIEADDPRRRFIEDEIVFVLRQRTMDLQQQLAVNQQGVLAAALIIRNNRELIRGVDRSIDVTVSALQVAVAVAMAVAHQKVVLDKVEALDRTTSDLIAGTASRLRKQGADIHRQASSAMLDMESLQSAFADIEVALDEISHYRREALPQMASQILELDQLIREAEAAVEKHERGRTELATLDVERPE